jgi:hypothetical protein
MDAFRSVSRLRAVASVLVGAYLVATLHGCLVLHGVCAAHGESVHLSGAPDPRPALVLGSRCDVDVGEASSRSDGGGCCEHCSIGAARWLGAACAQAHGAFALPPDCTASCRPPSARSAVQAALLDLAPKTSPPS